MSVKIKDWYFAGLLFGSTSGAIVDLIVLILLLLGVVSTSPWSDMTQILFKPPASDHLLAKVYGLLAAIAAAGATGVVSALLLKLTGKDYIYVKTISMGIGNQIFTFLILYPALGFRTIQHLPHVPFASTILFSIYGLINGFLFKHYADFKT